MASVVAVATITKINIKHHFTILSINTKVYLCLKRISLYQKTIVAIEAVVAAAIVDFVASMAAMDFVVI